MNKAILSLYDFFKKHRALAWSACVVVSLALLLSIVTLHYKEDISDFLPLDEQNHTALAVYQDISGAGNIYAVIGTCDTVCPDPQLLADGVESFVQNIESSDSLHFVESIVKEIDLERILDIADNVYENIPYFLTESDYARIDSLLSQPQYIPQQVEADKQMLMFPSSNLVAVNIARDPLNLFSPVLDRLSSSSQSIQYESYDGYILSPDSRRAIVIITSSFGANESENNALLVNLLENAAKQVRANNTNLDIHIIGGPVIAVTNANRIKSDSILAVCIAGILILALLIYVFRNIRNILLIVVSVAWGWIFAMGIIGVFYSSVSIIVIGIASVILGIAVNYPLHLIDHLKDSSHPRSALKEIISPLVVGNVTTVGAFLCLVPLNAPALHDLGLFASLLLAGTIIFVLIWLPHVVKTRKPADKATPEPKLITRLANISLENSKITVAVILVLTAVFAFFSLRTEFDSDMRNINYMTAQQREDMEYFHNLIAGTSDTETLYVVSYGDDQNSALAQNEIITPIIDSLVGQGKVTLHNHVSSFLTSASTQSQRLERWKNFILNHREKIKSALSQAAADNGFSPSAFKAFENILDNEYPQVEPEHFQPLYSTAFKSNISENSQSSKKYIVQALEVNPANIEQVKEQLRATPQFGGMVFDVKSMNGAIADTLSNDFNYIGIVCGFIVFIFLWISLGSIELAIVSFLPMAISWIWILGIMGILGIKFNIVNIILATFIFGQGDDYTIFITEGLSYELAYRRKLLASYKNSIIVSALIMFIGIGTLIFAKHPALRSLGEVTIVGMLSVVLMAYLFPPLIFNFLVRKNGHLRKRPLTLKKILCTAFCAAIFLSQLAVAYILDFFMFVITKPTPRKQLLLHRFCCSVFRWDVKRMPGLKFRYINAVNENFNKPAVIISNHQSLLDSFYLMTLTPKMVMVANDHVSKNFITGRIFRHLGFITVGMGVERMVEKLRPYVEQGYSVAIFPEGERLRNVCNSVKRFHKGMIQFAQDLKLDILPVYLHGVVQAMPKGSVISNGGEVVLEVGKRIPCNKICTFGETSKDQVQAIRKTYLAHFSKLCRSQSTVKLLFNAVYDRYRYKGAEIEHNAKKALNCCLKNSNRIEGRYDNRNFLVIDNAGQGELALLLALMYPERQIEYYNTNTDELTIAKVCFNEYVCNITIADAQEINTADLTETDIYIFGPKPDEIPIPENSSITRIQ
ncbi:MAG: MMPL family transporter [Muribaculaceae bacterium]|nr:MMPL family transporter [Muribaculaceae bacterium]